MLAYIIRRLVYGVVTLLALSVIVFTLLQLTGGGPLDRLRLNPRMAPHIATLTELWGLDQPAWRQYFAWLDNYTDLTEISLQNFLPVIAIGVAVALTLLVLKVLESQWKGLYLVGIWVLTLWIAISNTTIKFDWGMSFAGSGDVWDLVFSRVGATFRLGFASLAIALLLGVSLGIYQAVRQYSFFDQLGTLGAFFAFSTPIFVIALGLQIILALYLERWTGVKLFFVTGMNSPGYSDMTTMGQIVDTMQHLTLPALSMGLISLAVYARFQRTSMLEVLHSDYLRTAKSKGLPRRKVIIKHALRNAMIPVVTLISLDIAGMVGGAIITESIFGWPGVGRLYIDAITNLDYPVVMAIVLLIGMGLVFMNIVADILYGVLDPRVRYE